MERSKEAFHHLHPYTIRYKKSEQQKLPKTIFDYYRFDLITGKINVQQIFQELEKNMSIFDSSGKKHFSAAFS